MKTTGGQFTAFPDSSALDKSTRMGINPSKGTHGTTMKSPVPSEILPANAAGKSTNHGYSDPDRAYYNSEANPVTFNDGTPDPPSTYASKQGWKWAHEAVGMSMGNAHKPRAVVHDVLPVGTVSADVNLAHTSAMTADKLKVVDTEWIPHSNSRGSTGVQGTLPNVNWNQFGDRPTMGVDHNWHEYGVNPSETGEQRVLRRMVADGRLPSDSPHNPDFDAIRNRNVRKPEISGQMEMVDRPPTWYDEGQKADI